MKVIEYRVEYQCGDGTVTTDDIVIRARSINTGFPKAAARASRGLPKGWEITSITFWTLV